MSPLPPVGKTHYEIRLQKKKKKLSTYVLENKSYSQTHNEEGLTIAEIYQKN